MSNSITSTIISSIDNEKPSFRNPIDAIIVALHITMKSLQFRCVGCGEVIDEKENEKLLPEGWNKSQDAYSFRYKHPKSSMTFLVKSIVMGEKLLVHGLAIEDNKIHTFELSPKDYIQHESWNNNNQSSISIYKNLQDLISLFKINIVNKLLPPPEKEGYEHTTTSTIETSSTSSSSRLAEGGPMYVQPPRFDEDDDYDPLRIPGTGNRMPRGGPYNPYAYPQPPQPSTPFGIGGEDIFPSIPLG